MACTPCTFQGLSLQFQAPCLSSSTPPSFPSSPHPISPHYLFCLSSPLFYIPLCFVLFPDRFLPHGGRMAANNSRSPSPSLQKERLHPPMISTETLDPPWLSQIWPLAQPWANFCGQRDWSCCPTCYRHRWGEADSSQSMWRSRRRSMASRECDFTVMRKSWTTNSKVLSITIFLPC